MTRTTTARFHIQGSARRRPPSTRVVYADGAGGDERRPGVDLELSHWVPNATPARYAADTSTEICLRWVAAPSHDDVDLVVNDHVDIDGILSLYVLLHPELASVHAATLAGAAAMGDFGAWAERPAFSLAQQLALLLAGDRPADPGDCYARAFTLVTDVLTGAAPEPPEVEDGFTRLARGAERLGGDITVTAVGDRLVSFVRPAADADDLGRALGVPRLNAVVDDALSLWPHSRDRRHGERVHLVSLPYDGGWFHDVWLPGYCWAETPGRWTPPGLVSTGSSNRWRVDHPALDEAVARLGALDGAGRRWHAAAFVTPFDAVGSRGFPVVACSVDGDGRPAPSALDPDGVAEVLAGVW